MIEQKKMIGTVTWPPNNQACYVRVNLSDWRGGIPLAIKATFSDFDRRDIKKGDVVEVERNDPRDARRFRVLRLMKAVEPKKPIHITTKTCGAVDTMDLVNLTTELKEKTMEKVKFYLNSNYFSHPEMKGVLNRAFGLRPGEFAGIRCRGIGITLLCTTDQFARFLIYRNLSGIKNGFMDLSPRLVQPEQPDAYKKLAKIAGITREQAKRVALALCYSGPQDIMDRIKPSPHVVDVADR
jgi:hypothetical protein